MSSLTSALSDLDHSLQSLESQLNSLRAAQAVDDTQLSRSLMDICQQAARLRILIRARSATASWNDRESLCRLIEELENGSQPYERRRKVQKLADELNAGQVKHRQESRGAALERLRLTAVGELLAKAAATAEAVELPGPSAAQWLPWAWQLNEEGNAPILAALRRDFPSLAAFVSEMDEGDWAPAPQPQHEEPVAQGGHTVAPLRLTPTLVPASGASSNQRSQTWKARFDQAIQAGNFTAALSLCSDGQTGDAEVAEEPAAHADAGVQSAPSATAAATEPVAVATEPAVAETPAEPQRKFCDQCQCSYPADFDACPIDGSALRVPSQLIPGMPLEESYRLLDQMVKYPRGTFSMNAGPVAAGGPALRLDPAQTDAWSSDDARAESESRAPRRRRVPIGVWITLVMLLGLAAIAMGAYLFAPVTRSKVTSVIPAADATVTRPVVIPDADIQKDVENRLSVLPGSRIRVSVSDGVVTLGGRTFARKREQAEKLAVQAAGVKSVQNGIQLVVFNPEAGTIVPAGDGISALPANSANATHSRQR